MAPFNIDARLNGAYIALGLLYGEGDFAKTLEISTRSGQDSDCNPSSAAGVLGVMVGYEAIPDQFKSGIPAIENEKFSYTRYSFNDIVASTLARAETIIESAGGQVTDTEVVIPCSRRPRRRSSSGTPTHRSPAWGPTTRPGSGKAPGRTETFESRWSEWKARQTTETGAEAELTFEGTGVAVIGSMTQEGGRADVFLDGEKSDHVLDAWIPERTYDNDYWHVTGLRAG